MKNIGNRKNCYFEYSKVIELINLVISIFFKDNKLKNYESIYDIDYIESLKKKYRFLEEILQSLQNGGTGFLEFLLINMDFNSIEEFKKYLLSFEEDEFFYIFYGKDIEKSIIQFALQGDDNLSVFYSKYEHISSSYLALKTLFSNRELFIEEFFKCAEELDGDEFEKAISSLNTQIKEEETRIHDGLLENEPLELSQIIMGKTFKNRGPYKNFIFIPSYFTIFKSIRFFTDNQVLIYSLRNKEISEKDAIKTLKVMCDESRFKILEILWESGPMMGKELAEQLGIATSTLSHHIEQLKTASFINEERVKNSKYYSINVRSMNVFLEYLNNKFKNKK